jgi:micrococcal nuclease
MNNSILNIELQLYNYKSTVIKVYDGDTITVDIDLGLCTWIKNQKIRLSRINSKEIKGIERPDGVLAREFLSKLILGKEIIIKTKKDSKEKYGRWLGEIFIKADDDIMININDFMIIVEINIIHPRLIWI